MLEFLDESFCSTEDQLFYVGVQEQDDRYDLECAIKVLANGADVTAGSTDNGTRAKDEDLSTEFDVGQWLTGLNLSTYCGLFRVNVTLM